MGTVYAEITLKNGGDAIDGKRGLIKEDAIHSLTVNAIVDTGAGTLVISEEQRLQLGLEVRREHVVRMANNVQETVKITDPVEIHWKNRESICFPWVIPDSPKVLLGAIPLEDMDLIVDPKNEELVGRHGEEMEGYLYGIPA